MDGDVKEALVTAAQEVLDTIESAVEEAVTAAVTNLRDKCNEFLGEGEAPPEATEAPAAE